MHNATTKQRLSALRRRLGIFSGAPRWVRERRGRLARLEAAAASMLGFGRAAEQVAEATPVPALAGGMQMLSSSLPDEEASSTRWASTSTSEPATEVASREREVVTTSDLVPATDASSPRQVSTSMIEPLTTQAASPAEEVLVATSDFVRDSSTSSPRQVSTSMIEPATREPSRQRTQETGRNADLDTTSDIVRDGSTSSPRRVSTSMIEPATREPSRRWTQETSRNADLDTTSDIVQTGKTFRRPARARAEASGEATEPARSGFPRRAAALAAAAVAAVIGLFLALRPRTPAPPERAPEVEAPALPAPAVPAPAITAPAVAAPTPAVAAPAPEAAALPAAPTAVVIRRGDTLWALASVHLGDPMLWPKLHAANRDRIRDPDLIYPGQQIELPER